jgi:hypothetical protein
MATLCTPVSIVESYFSVELKRSELKRFDKVSTRRWIEFARHYRAQMKDRFAEDFLTAPTDSERSLRLYFEPLLVDTWDAVVRERYEPTPLLGKSGKPPEPETITRELVSAMLNPLKKHLLMADAVYVRDNFYYCFDGMAELDAGPMPTDPIAQAMIEEGTRRIKGWLPILAELRPLIMSGALVFMPDYITPSFPYGGRSPRIKAAFDKLRMRPGVDQYQKAGKADGKEALRTLRAMAAGTFVLPPAPPRVGIEDEYFNEENVMGGWLNARLLNLDPVFPTRRMSDWAGRLYFDDGPESGDFTSDLLSIAVLPFEDERDLNLTDLIKMRRDEPAFSEMKRIVRVCKSYVETLSPTTPQELITLGCEKRVKEELERYEAKSVLRFVKPLEEKTVPGLVYAIGVNVAFIAASPLLGLVGDTLLSPRIFRIVQSKVDPKRRAIGRVQTMLAS